VEAAQIYRADPISRLRWKLEVFFMHHLPIEDSIDLHSFRPKDIVSVVDEYIRAAAESGLREVRLIHGRGIGVQRGMVQATLEKHPIVEEFWDAPESHLGATVVRLRRST
jgi:DNA-nicking Smr family endonuclease